MSHSWHEIQQCPNKGYYLRHKEIKCLRKYADNCVQQSKSKDFEDQIEDLKEAMKALSSAISQNNQNIKNYDLPNRVTKKAMKRGLRDIDEYCRIKDLIEINTNISKQTNCVKEQTEKVCMWEPRKQLPVGLAKEGTDLFKHCVTFPPKESCDKDWKAVVGHEAAKAYIQQSLKYPVVFNGQIPPKMKAIGILLYGPPGTGKTMIATAIAKKMKVCYIHLQAGELMSKWQGQSEENIRKFFAMVEYLLPCILFVDEIEALVGRRETESEKPDSKRGISNQLLPLLENKPGLFMVGATNMPWQIDPAFARRLGMKFYVPLPNYDQRKKIIEDQLKDIPHSLLKCDISAMANKLDGYSGSDIVSFIRDANIKRFHKAAKSLHFAQSADGSWHPCTTFNPLATRITADELKVKGQQVIAPNLSVIDLEITKIQKTSALKDIAKYEEFSREN